VAESSSVGFNQGVREESLALEAFGPGLALSSLQLGASTVTDTVTGAVSVIPNPGLVFGAGGSDAVYVYFEGYGLSADTNQYRVDLAVIRPEPGGVDTVVQGRPVFRAKSGTSVATALGVNIEGLAPGRYALALCLTDLGTGRQVSQIHRFRVGGEQAEPGFRVSLDSLTERERRFYQEIEHIATPKEFKYFRALSDSGQQAWLAWFWSRHNLTEYARRMEAATEKYRRQRTPGVKTDRGRIYVKYGEPDAIEQKVIETESRPREYWHYYGSGYTFVFIDIRGDGNYRLAWTNSREEPPTGFEEYLTPAEQEEFR
jgi:GWxTD domain-containing protein